MIANIHPETVTKLEYLLSRNVDAMKGYMEVANNLNSPELTKFMVNYSRQRERFIEELQHEIAAFDGDVSAEGSFLGELHHIWVDLKAQWTDNNTVSLLEECIRGEEKAKEDYAAILNVKSIPQSTRIMLKRQEDKISEAISNLRALRKIEA